MFAAKTTTARNEAVRLCIASAVAMVLVLLTAACGGSEEKQGLVGEVTAAEVKSVAPEVGSVTQTVAASGSVAKTAVVSPTVTAAEAEAAYNEKRYGDATEMFAVIASRRPENAWGHYMHGLSAWKSGDNVRAEKALLLALERDSKHVKAHLNLARVFIEGGRAPEALPHVETAISLDAVSVDGYRLLGRVRGDLKETEPAIAAYRKAIGLNDKDSWSMNNMGLVFIQNGQFEEALGPLARATELNTGVAVFWNNLGMSLERTGRYSQASEAYKSAVAATGGHAKAAASLARLNGRPDDRFVASVDLKELARVFAASVSSWR